jgi:hypothetical protein
VINAVIAAVVTLVLRAVKVADETDETSADDYFVDRAESAA